MQLPNPFFVLAPMDDVTDTVFRRVVADCAPPDLTVTEFVNVEGLVSPGREKLLKKLDTRHDTVPVVAQLWGKNPDSYRTIAAELAESGKYAGIDINMGCPDKTVIKNGCCSALMNDRERAVAIIQAVREGVGSLPCPVSVKTRLGFNAIDYTWHELLLQQKLNMLTIHVRTKKDMSDVPARWEAIDEIVLLRDKLSPGTLIVGNGDIMSRQEGLDIAKTHKLDGVMIGRGVFHDPYVFAAESPWPTMSKAERLALYEKQVRLFEETWKNGERRVHTLNRFCKVYVNGFDGAKELREQLMDANTTTELLTILYNEVPLL